MTDKYRDKESKKSTARIILFDGILIRGGFFALWLVVGGFFIDWLFGKTTSFADYVSARTTWTYFVFWLLAFGLFIGLDRWFRHKGKEVKRYKIT